MEPAGSGGMGAAAAMQVIEDAEEVETAASLTARNTAAAQVDGVAPLPLNPGAGAGAVNVQGIVGNAAPAAPAVGPAAVVLAAAPVAAMLAVPVMPNLAIPPVGAQPRFDVDAVLSGPLPTKSNFAGYEIYPWLG